MSPTNAVIALIAAVVVTVPVAVAQDEGVAGRLQDVQRTLAEVRTTMSELLEDKTVAQRVIEKVRAELREVVTDEQAERMREILHAYGRRLEQNAHWLERLVEHEGRLEQLQRRLGRELGPLQERQRERRMQERMARIDELARGVAETHAAVRPDLRDDERELLVAQVETLRMALPVLREEGRLEEIEAVELAVGARLMALEHRYDREAQRIRERAPRSGALVEILALAEELYREYGDQERARELSRLTERLWGARERDALRDASHDLQTMEQAVRVLREAERPDAADLMRRALEARIVELEQVRGPEADRVRERAPGREQIVELLRVAARWWDEFGHEGNAEAARELAERVLHGSGEPRRDRDHDRARDRAPRGGEHREAVLHRIEMLQERMAQIREMLERMQHELQELESLAR